MPRKWWGEQPPSAVSEPTRDELLKGSLLSVQTAVAIGLETFA